jgi:hypothetical protein
MSFRRSRQTLYIDITQTLLIQMERAGLRPAPTILVAFDSASALVVNLQVVFGTSSVTYFWAALRNGVIMSIGNGKIMVEFFSAAISVRVCK